VVGLGRTLKNITFSFIRMEMYQLYIAGVMKHVVNNESFHTRTTVFHYYFCFTDEIPRLWQKWQMRIKAREQIFISRYIIFKHFPYRAWKYRLEKRVRSNHETPHVSTFMLKLVNNNNNIIYRYRYHTRC